MIATGIASASLGACSSTTASTGPAIDFTLCFDVYTAGGAGLAGNCASSHTAPCVPFGADADHSLSLVIDTPSHAGALVLSQTWQFQVPNGCVGVPDCGFGVVTIDPGTPSEHQVATAGPSVLVPMSDFSGQPGPHTILLQLRNSDGSRAVDSHGAPYVTELSIDVCAPSDAGTGPETGPPDSGTDGASVNDASTDASGDGSIPADAAFDAATRDQTSPPVDAATDAARDATGE